MRRSFALASSLIALCAGFAVACLHPPGSTGFHHPPPDGIGWVLEDLSPPAPPDLPEASVVKMAAIPGIRERLLAIGNGEPIGHNEQGEPFSASRKTQIKAMWYVYQIDRVMKRPDS